MTQTTQQTILVAAFCDGGDWIADLNSNGKLSFLSTPRRHDESAAQAAARCIRDNLWAESPLGEQDFMMVSHDAHSNTKLFVLNWLLPVSHLDMERRVLSSNRINYTPAGMSVRSLRALARAPGLKRHMRGNSLHA